MSAPTISAVIPTRNRPRLLQGALASVALQDVPDLEVIVVDDASEQGAETAGVVEAFREHLQIRTIRLTHQGGTGRARNVGVLAARGEYVAFLDDDDLWHPGKLRKQLARFQTNPRRLPRLGVVYTWHQWVDETTRRVRVRRRPRLETLDDLFRWSYNTPQTMLIRRTCFDSVGLFDEHMPTKQDFDLLARLIQKFQFDAVEEILVSCRDHAGPRRTDDYRARAQGAEILLQRYARLVRDPRALREMYYSVGRLHLRAQAFDQAAVELGTALRLARLPQKPRHLLFFALAGARRFLAQGGRRIPA